MLNIALVIGFNSDLEAQSIRASLEYFGAAEIYKYAKLHNTHIVNSGCTLGDQNLFYIVVRNHILDRLIM